MVVAIGPYHRGSKHLQKMEEVKRAAAFQFCNGWQGKAPEEGNPPPPPLETVHGAVLSVAARACKLYAGDAVVGMRDRDFAAMMFLDGCFLLQYMESYPLFKSIKGSTVDEALRQFLFTNRASINNDIMLLENQLPWLVLDTIISSLENRKGHYLDVVMRFIEEMGKTFEIVLDVSDNNNSRPPPPLPTPPPPHLLGLLQRHKTEPGPDVKWTKVGRISAFSAIELAEIGVKLKASKTALFTDMDVGKRGPLCGKLSLAPLSLNSTTACWLVNMAAFEVSTASTFQDDHPDRTAVCSYLALLSMFMLREEDVHEMRAKRILHGHRSNAEMLTFFKGVVDLLPDTGCRFTHIMSCIAAYKAKRWIQTKLHQLVYINLWTIIPVLTIIGMLVGILQGIQSLKQGQKNDTP